MSSSGIPSCLNCFQPQLSAVGTCALNIAPNTSLCSPGVGTASCGMSQVTVAASKKTNILPWIGVAVVFWLVFRKRR